MGSGLSGGGCSPRATEGRSAAAGRPGGGGGRRGGEGATDKAAGDGVWAGAGAGESKAITAVLGGGRRGRARVPLAGAELR